MSGAEPGADLVRRLAAIRDATVEPNASLRAHTTLKVGGPAAALVTAESLDGLVEVAHVCAARETPVLVLGKGSNLLVADEGFPGVVLTLGRAFRSVAVDGERVVAGAAEPMPILARAVAHEGLGGLAFGVAIPGALGGAVRMNAGAHGGETREVLEWAEAVRFADHGRVHRFSRDELGMSYRHTELPADAVVVRAGLRLRRADRAALAAEMDEMKRWRREHQPVNEPSCGSVFRNPPGDSAGRLLEAAGVKGHRVGGATISPRHANFITASPSATAGDVWRVIQDARAAVRDAFGVELVTEVVTVGFGAGA
jgi:UDP-N-acetylmuramate dehydrogenase